MKKKHNQGFSLVELILAIAILAIIMVAVASFMNSTTRVYNRTKNGIEVSQDSQDLYDLISDKIMQAKEIRIGRDGKEYAIVGTNSSTKVGALNELLKEDNTAATTSRTGNALYSFDALTEEETDIKYICIYYDTTPLADGRYGPAIDVFYFCNGNVYLVRNVGGVRSNSIYNTSSLPTADQDKPKVSLNSSISRLATDTWMNNCISNTVVTNDTVYGDIYHSGSWTTTDLEDYLVCENVEHMYVYADPEENALYLQVDLKKKGRESTSEGMITIRNSYVLAPKDTGNGN